MTSEQEQSLARLKEAHTFPGPFAFKAIGPPGPAFAQGCTDAVAKALGPSANVQVSVRESATAKHAAITLRVHCERAENVLAVYAALGQAPGLKLLL